MLKKDLRLSRSWNKVMTTTVLKLLSLILLSFGYHQEQRLHNVILKRSRTAHNSSLGVCV